MASSIPKTNDQKIFEWLNSAQASCLVQDFNSFQARSIERLINQNTDYVMRYSELAAFASVTGKPQKVIEYTNALKRLNPDLPKVLSAVVSMLSSGLYSAARDWLRGVSRNETVVHHNQIIIYLCATLLFEDLTSVYDLRSNAGLLSTQEETLMRVASEVRSLMDNYSISEQAIISMCDVAGKVLLEEGHIVTSATPYIAMDCIVCRFYLKASPKEIAEIEWKFVDTLFDQQPNAPVEHVQIIFTSEGAHPGNGDTSND